MLHEQILLIRDENAYGKIYNEFKLCFDSVQITVSDIVTERVYHEVEKYKQHAQDYQYALVKPKQDEILLNQSIPNARKNSANHSRKEINAAYQVEVALKAFTSNGYFILIDDIQAGSLAQIVTIKPGTTVSFMRLMPLVGG